MPDLIDLSDRREREFETIFLVQGVGTLKTRGRYARAFRTAIAHQQPFLEIQDEDEVTIVLPTQLILFCMERIYDPEADPGIPPIDSNAGSDEGGTKSELGESDGEER